MPLVSVAESSCFCYISAEISCSAMTRGDEPQLSRTGGGVIYYPPLLHTQLIFQKSPRFYIYNINFRNIFLPYTYPTISSNPSSTSYKYCLPQLPLPSFLAPLAGGTLYVPLHQKAWEGLRYITGK